MTKRLLLAIIFAMVTAIGTHATPTQIKLVFEEMALESLGHPSAGVQDVRVNRAGTIAAWTCKKSGSQAVVINGKQGPSFDWVDGPNFSADGKHVFYLANRGGTISNSRWEFMPKGGQWFRGLDDQVGPGYADLALLPNDDQGFARKTAADPFRTTSINGKHTAVAVNEGDQRRVIADGKAGPIYAGVMWPVFSDDARRLAYIAYRPNPDRPCGDSFVVVDGHEETAYDEICYRSHEEEYGISLCFSPDGKHVAYVARYMGTLTDGQYGDIHFVVLDGKNLDGKGRDAQNGYYQAPAPVFSAASQWIAYGRTDQEDHRIVVRSVDGQTYAKSQSYRQVWLPHYQAGGIIHFFGLRDQTIYRVEAKIGD